MATWLKFHAIRVAPTYHKSQEYWHWGEFLVNHQLSTSNHVGSCRHPTASFACLKNITIIKFFQPPAWWRSSQCFPSSSRSLVEGAPNSNSLNNCTYFCQKQSVNLVDFSFQATSTVFISQHRRSRITASPWKLPFISINFKSLQNPYSTIHMSFLLNIRSTSTPHTRFSSKHPGKCWVFPSFIEFSRFQDPTPWGIWFWQ